VSKLDFLDFLFTGFRSRTPRPPPFSLMNPLRPTRATSSAHETGVLSFFPGRNGSLAADCFRPAAGGLEVLAVSAERAAAALVRRTRQHPSVMAASNTVELFFQTSVAARLNTTKCDSEKLTRKLAPVASTFPSRTGMKCDAITTDAVFAAKPAT